MIVDLRNVDVQDIGNQLSGLAKRLELLQVLDDNQHSASFSFSKPAITPRRFSTSASSANSTESRVDLARKEINIQLKETFAEDDAAIAELKARRRHRIRQLESAYKIAEAKKQEEARRLAERREAEEREMQRKEKELQEKLQREQAERAKAEKLRKEQEEREKVEKERQLQQQKANEARIKEAAEKDRIEKEKLAQAEQEKARIAKEKAAQASEAKLQQSSQAGSAGFTNWADVQAEWEKHMEVIKYAKEVVNPEMSRNLQLKKECMDLKLKIKSRLGQLTPSRSHVSKILGELKEVCEKARKMGDLAYNWTLNQFAKIVVQQGERETNVDGRMSVPVGMVTTIIWASHPDFGKYLLARFVKKCPQVIGWQCPINTEQGRKRMGWRRPDGERWESEVAYSERIGGMVSVWAVITQSKMNEKTTLKHPYPISHSWVFLARQMNRPVDNVMNSDFSAVAAWWDVAALRFLEYFGKQGEKMLKAACETWVRSAEGKKFAAANRLRLLGEDWKREGKITPVWKPLGP